MIASSSGCNLGLAARTSDHSAYVWARYDKSLALKALSLALGFASPWLVTYPQPESTVLYE